MNKYRYIFWASWLAFNALWLFGAPELFGIWLHHEVQVEYASGARVTTDGDSIAIPVAGFAQLNLYVLILVNIALGIYAFIKRMRAAQPGVQADRP